MVAHHALGTGAPPPGPSPHAPRGIRPGHVSTIRSPGRAGVHAAFLLTAISVNACDHGPETVSLPRERLARATELRIWDEWQGLSPASPAIASYNLMRNGEAFEGTARFGVGYSETCSGTADAVVSVPPDAFATFIDVLVAARLEPGEYEPLFDHTDDYPHLVIRFVVDGENIDIFSESQGEAYVPWGARFDDDEYTIDSSAPYDALKTLDPYLKPEMLDALIDEVWSSDTPECRW